MNPQQKDRAAIIAPPPMLFFMCLSAGSVFSSLFPETTLHASWPVRLIPGFLLFGLAGLIAFSAFRAFKTHQTPFDPYKKTVRVIQDGPFRFSRNPLYLGLMLLFAGFVFLLASVWMVLFMAVFFMLLVYGVIRPEERYLEEKFGEEYLRYKKSVRRWL